MNEAEERDDKEVGRPEEDAPQPEEAPAEQPAEPEQAEQPEEDEAQLVNLPRLLADEFGISASEARMMVQSGRVEIDGEVHAGDRFNVSHDEIAGKTIKVEGETKTYQFQYRDEEPPPVGEQRDNRR